MLRSDGALWAIAHHDCSTEPTDELLHDRARFVLDRHEGHGSGCRQYAAAMEALSTPLSA